MASVFRNKNRDRQRSLDRMADRVRNMKGEHWCMLDIKGISPYSISRVEGTYQVEFSRTGRSLRCDEMYDVWVKAYEVTGPGIHPIRVASLSKAKAIAEVLRT